MNYLLRRKQRTQQTSTNSPPWTLSNQPSPQQTYTSHDFYDENVSPEPQFHSIQEEEYRQAREYLIKHVNNTPLDHGSPQTREDSLWPEFIEVLDDLQDAIRQRGIRTSLVDAVQLLAEVCEDDFGNEEYVESGIVDNEFVQGDGGSDEGVFGDPELDGDGSIGDIVIGYEPSVHDDVEDRNDWALPPTSTFTRLDYPPRVVSKGCKQRLEPILEENEDEEQRVAKRIPAKRLKRKSRTDSGFHSGSLKVIFEGDDDEFRPPVPPKDKNYLSGRQSSSQVSPSQHIDQGEFMRALPNISSERTSPRSIMNYIRNDSPDIITHDPQDDLQQLAYVDQQEYPLQISPMTHFTPEEPELKSRWSPDTPDSDEPLFEWPFFQNRKKGHVRTKSKEGLLQQLAGSEAAIRMIKLLKKRKRPVGSRRVEGDGSPSELSEKALRVLGAGVEEVSAVEGWDRSGEGEFF